MQDQHERRAILVPLSARLEHLVDDLDVSVLDVDAPEAAAEQGDDQVQDRVQVLAPRHPLELVRRHELPIEVVDPAGDQGQDRRHPAVSARHGAQHDGPAPGTASAA